MLTVAFLLVAGLGQSAVIANWLGPTGKGKLVLLLWAPNLILVFLGAFRQVATWALGKEVEERQAVLGNVLGMWCVGSLGGMALCAAIYCFQVPEGLGWLAISAGLLYIPTQVLVLFMLGLAMGMRWMSRVDKAQFLLQMATVTFVAAALVWLKLGVGGAAAAMVLATILPLVYCLWWARELGPLVPRFEPGTQKRLFSKGLIFSLALLAYSLNYRIDEILISLMLDEERLGIYAQGVSVIELVLKAPNVLVMVVFSHSATADKPEQFRQRIQRIIRFVIPAMAVVSLGLCVVAPWAVPLVFGEAFRPSVPVIWALAPGVVAVGAFQLAVSEFHGRGRPDVGLRYGLMALAINIVLNLLLIPRYEVVGVAIASTISYAFLAVAVLWAHRASVAEE